MTSPANKAETQCVRAFPWEDVLLFLTRDPQVCLFVYLSICLSVCLSMCLSNFLFVFLSVCLSVCLSVFLSDSLIVCLSDFQTIGPLPAGLRRLRFSGGTGGGGWGLVNRSGRERAGVGLPWGTLGRLWSDVCFRLKLLVVVRSGRIRLSFVYAVIKNRE